MSQRAARALQCSQLAFGCCVRGSTHFGASTRCKAQSDACPCYFLHCQAWLECDAARSKTPPQGQCLGPGRPPAYMPCRICKAEGCSGMLQAAQLAPSLLAAERICCRLCALTCVSSRSVVPAPHLCLHRCRLHVLAPAGGRRGDPSWSCGVWPAGGEPCSAQMLGEHISLAVSSCLRMC